MYSRKNYLLKAVPQKRMVTKHVLSSRGSAKIAYEEFGQGPIILFFTGAWVRPRIFKILIQLLSKQYRVIVPHIPPFGESSLTPPHITFDEYGILFAEFIRSLGISSCFIVGHSFGGMVALYTAFYSKNVNKILLVNPMMEEFSPQKDTKEYLRIIYRVIVTMIAQKELPHLSLIVQNACMVVWKHRRNVSSFCNNLIFTLRSTMAREKFPASNVTVLWGIDDEALGSHVLSHIEQRIPRVCIKKVFGRHNWCITDQQRAYRLIHRYLQNE